MPPGIRTAGCTASETAFSCIQNWIQTCSTEHEECGAIEDAKLPTRLVDVGLKDGIIKLLETKGQSGKYAALSHCWGKERIITTTKATLKERKEGIRFEQLSETFYQAIQLTRRLAIPYLWIDSLCIIQDDKTDWAKEASKMASFYQNAVFTIAATSSSSSNGGLYRSNPDFVLSGLWSTNEPYRLIFREWIEHEMMDAHSDQLRKKFPLMSRAWILQERLLSSRVVHFGPHEVFFECREGAECECGDIAGFELDAPLPKLTYADSLICGDNAWYLARSWRALVGLYTGLFISFSSDILPALGGLARDMSKLRTGKYVAGLWGDSINDDMLWRSGPTSVRPVWRAPSWSWASVQHPIWYDDAPLAYNQDDTYTKMRPSFQHFSKIVDHRCKLKFGDSFGELESAELRMQGRCVSGTLHYWSPSESGLTLEGRDRSSQAPKKMTYAIQFPDATAYRIIPDYGLEEPSRDFVATNTKVVCVLMSVVSDEFSAHRRSYGIILVRPDLTQEVYERIALLALNDRLGDNIDAMLDKFPEELRELTLI